MRNRFYSMQFKAFTLAELLIALAILGVIATFTIPKVLIAQQNGKWNAMGKETIAMVSGAFQAYQLDEAIDENTKPADLTPYMNYVALLTNAEQIDSQPGIGSLDCTSATPCLKLHNGGILLANTDGFGGSQPTTNMFYFMFDPDGVYSGTLSGEGKSLPIYVYFNGRILTPEGINPNSTDESGFLFDPCDCNPDWFSWN